MQVQRLNNKTCIFSSALWFVFPFIPGCLHLWPNTGTSLLSLCIPHAFPAVHVHVLVMILNLLGIPSNLGAKEVNWGVPALRGPFPSPCLLSTKYTTHSCIAHIVRNFINTQLQFKFRYMSWSNFFKCLSTTIWKEHTCKYIMVKSLGKAASYRSYRWVLF